MTANPPPPGYGPPPTAGYGPPRAVGYGSPPAAGYGAPGWLGHAPPVRARTPVALVGCAIVTAVLVVVGPVPTFGETRIDDRVSGGSGWRGYSRAVGEEATTSYSIPGQGVTLLLAAAVLLIGAGLLLRPAARSTGAALAVLGAGLTLGVVIWLFLGELGRANSLEARVPDADVEVTLGLGAWLLAVAGLAAAATAVLGIAAVRRAGRSAVA